MHPLLRVLLFMLDEMPMLDDVVVVLYDPLHELYYLALLGQRWFFSLSLFHFPQNPLIFQSSELLFHLFHFLALLCLLTKLSGLYIRQNWSFLAGCLLLFMADRRIDKFVSPSNSQSLLNICLLLVLFLVSFIHDYYL